jgi:ferrous iron transport protein A
MASIIIVKNMENDSSIPLNAVPNGEQVQIVSICAGWGLRRRLADMGLTPGLSVRIVGSQRPGSVVLDVRGSRLALGRGISHRIMVRAQSDWKGDKENRTRHGWNRHKKNHGSSGG